MSKKYTFIVGTVLGATEYVAEALGQYITEKGYDYSIELEPNLNEISKDSIWVVCCSTHGAGDLPDNIMRFSKQLNEADLSQVNAFLIGLGDTSYDTFCFAAKTLESQLKNAGCNLLAQPHYIDVLSHPIPEDDALAWFAKQIN